MKECMGAVRCLWLPRIYLLMMSPSATVRDIDIIKHVWALRFFTFCYTKSAGRVRTACGVIWVDEGEGMKEKHKSILKKMSFIIGALFICLISVCLAQT